MKAVVLKGINKLVIEDVKVPEPIDDEVLVKVDVVGICGSDVHILSGRIAEGIFPFIPGHEWVGRVVEVGRNVKTVKVGDRVIGGGSIPCRKCDICRNGGMSEHCKNPRVFGFETKSPGAMADYTLYPEEALYKIPDNFSDDLGVLIEPVSVGYHAIWDRSGGIGPHDRVVVIGAGPMGLVTTGIALVTGAQVIVVAHQSNRIKMAKDIGAKIIIDSSKVDPVKEILKLTNGLGATRIIECSGNSSATTMTVDIVAEDGIIVIVGLSSGARHPVEINKTVWRHSSITGSCGAPNFFLNTITFLSRGLIDFEKLITHRFPFDRVQEAFELCNKGTAGKILLYPGKVL